MTCVNHRRLEVLVSEQFLHGADIVTFSSRRMASECRSVRQVKRFPIPVVSAACFTVSVSSGWDFEFGRWEHGGFLVRSPIASLGESGSEQVRRCPCRPFALRGEQPYFEQNARCNRTRRTPVVWFYRQ